MRPNPPRYHLHLFLVPLWRGEIKNTGTGEAPYFRNSTARYDALCAMVNAAEQRQRR